MTDRNRNIDRFKSLDDFLKEEGILEETTEVAQNRVNKLLEEKDTDKGNE